jgi:diacylglycerol kinase family enzyme
MLTGVGVRGRSKICFHDLREFRLVAERPLHFEMDGEYLGERTSVEFSSVPSAIRVIC